MTRIAPYFMTKIMVPHHKRCDIGAMNKSASLVWIFIMLYGIALVRPALPLIEYALEMNVYLENCVNKQRPELQCNGQCVLMQKLKAFQEEASTPVPPASVKVNLLDYPIGFVETLDLSAPTLKINARQSSRITNLIPVSWATEIFHPPALCA